MLNVSFRSKIFLLIAAILVLVATFVMLVTRRNVTQTVMNSELRAMNNELKLIEYDMDVRWNALLDDKIGTVRSERLQLLETGNLVNSVLLNNAELAEHGVLNPSTAKQIAFNWLKSLHFDDQRQIFVYDANFKVLASNQKDVFKINLTKVFDFKGRSIAKALYDESHSSGYSFAIYHWPLTADSSRAETRYAHFGYFRPWDWIIVVSDSAKNLMKTIEKRRLQMETSVREILSKLVLADSGFVFIIDKNSKLVTPLPAHSPYLLSTVDQTTHQTLNQLIKPSVSRQPPQNIHFDHQGEHWQINTIQFDPLGWTIVGAVPIKDLTLPATLLLNRQAFIFSGMLLIALVLAWPVASHIARPLHQLSLYARQLSEQDLTAVSIVPSHIAALENDRDEVGRLAESFLFMNRKLHENVKRLMNETSARERFESELNIARAIQLGLLPVPLAPTMLERVNLHAVMLPAKEVGGDLYDYFALPDGRLCIVIGDVSDKGVPAALFMAVTRTLIRSTAEDEIDPALIVQRVNHRLSENNPNMMFVTLLLGVLDLETGTFEWVNAGHLAPIIVNAEGQIRHLEGRSGPACGVVQGILYRKLIAQLNTGDTLVGFTDGITEAMSLSGAQYGEERLFSLLSDSSENVIALSLRILTDVRSFTAGANQSDDITLIVVRHSC